MRTGIETLRGKSSRKRKQVASKRKTVFKEFGSKRVIGFKVKDNTRRLGPHSTSFTAPEGDVDAWNDDGYHLEVNQTATSGVHAPQRVDDGQQQDPSAGHASETITSRTRTHANASRPDRRHAEEAGWKQFRDASPDAYLQTDIHEASTPLSPLGVQASCL